MKHKFVWVITFIIIAIVAFTYFYLSSPYQKVDIYTAKDFDKEINIPIVSINDKKITREISTIIKESQRLPGILNVASPDYILEIHDFNKDMQTVFLWIRKDSIQGMYMYKNDTEKGYVISETKTEKLKKIVISIDN